MDIGSGEKPQREVVYVPCTPEAWEAMRANRLAVAKYRAKVFQAKLDLAKKLVEARAPA